MQKPISTKVHGILDFITAGMLMTLPRVMGWSKTVTHLLDSAAISAVGYSLLTRYEFGMVKVLPMKGHLTLDALSGGALIGAAAMLDDEDPEVRATLAGLGLWEISAALMTRTQPGPRIAAEDESSAVQPYRGDLSQQSMPVSPEQNLQASARDRDASRRDPGPLDATNRGDLSRHSMPVAADRNLAEAARE